MRPEPLRAACWACTLATAFLLTMAEGRFVNGFDLSGLRKWRDIGPRLTSWRWLRKPDLPLIPARGLVKLHLTRWSEAGNMSYVWLGWLS